MSLLDFDGLKSSIVVSSRAYTSLQGFSNLSGLSNLNRPDGVGCPSAYYFVKTSRNRMPYDRRVQEFNKPTIKQMMLEFVRAGTYSF